MTAATYPRRRRRWRRTIWILALLTLLGALGALVWYRQRTVQPAAAPLTAPLIVLVEQRDLTEQVTLQGTLQPRERVRVSFPADVPVREVLVAPGDEVVAGQPLARLETADLELRVTSTRAQLEQAQAAVARLQQGPTEAALVQAVARITSAEAALAAFAAEVQPSEVAVAAERLETARRRLADLESGATVPADVTAARAQAASAQDALSAALVAVKRTRDSASRAKTDAQQAMERSAQEVQRLQRTFSDATWDWDFVQRTERHPREKTIDADGDENNRRLAPFEVEQFRRALDDAEQALRNGEVTLKNLVEAFDQARENEVLLIAEAERGAAAAERTLAEAQAVIARAEGEARASLLLQARQEVVAAEEAQRALIADPARGGRAAELQAALVAAQSELAKLQAGPEAEELARAQAAIETARADVARAEAALEAATLRAPLAGTVVSLPLAPGVRTNEQDAVVIADLQAFRIVAPVNEQQVGLLGAEQEVAVLLDAVPTAALTGTIIRVSELPQEGAADGGNVAGVNAAGSLGGLYPVEVVTAGTVPELRVGMAATVQAVIVVEANVVLVPFQAVQYGADGPFVERVVGDVPPDGAAPPTEAVPVSLGTQRADLVVVLDGLVAGDQLVVPQIVAPGVPVLGG